MRDPSQLCMYSNGRVIFQNRLFLSLNTLFCDEHSLGAGCVYVLDFSSFIKELIKKTQGSVLDVDVWMELIDVIFLGRHVRNHRLHVKHTDYHSVGCLGETFSSRPILIRKWLIIAMTQHLFSTHHTRGGEVWDLASRITCRFWPTLNNI